MNNYLLFYKSNLKIKIFTILLVLLVISMLVISFFYKLSFYFSYNGLVTYDEGEYYVSIILSDNEFHKIKKSFLVVDKKCVLYDVVKIDSDYVLTDNGPKRWLYIKFDLKDEDKIINNVIKLKFVYENTIINRLKEMF